MIIGGRIYILQAIRAIGDGRGNEKAVIVDMIPKYIMNNF